MKKKIALLLSTMMIFAYALPFSACKDENEEAETNEEETVTGGYLTLNTYSATLKVGETLALDVKKFNDNDEEQSIDELYFVSETPKIASVENGTITAHAEGETYINVTADGLQTSVFVSVKTATVSDGLVIRFTSQKLYKGVEVQARAFILEKGVTVATPTDVTWSVSDAEILDITSSGMVTPKALAESTTIKASCIYDGKSYTAETQVSVVEPIYYAFDRTSVKLASGETVSGDENTTHTTTVVNVQKVNALSGESEILDASQLSLTVKDESVGSVSVATDGTITVQSTGVGATLIQATVTGEQSTLTLPLEVATPIATIEDMDTLSLALYNDKKLLAGNYMLVNDINYDGDVIMPITSYTGSTIATDTTAGIQWKYRLKATETGYAMEDRAKFGKAGTGLSDEEFAQFNTKHTTKGTFNTPFTGTIDGNGYSIQNAEIFYGAYVSVSKADNYMSHYTGIFGVFTGTLKNISFENITMQNPHDYMDLEISEYGLDRVYLADGTIIDGALRKDPLNAWTPQPLFHKATSYSLICKGENCTLENVYFELMKGLGKVSQGSTGVMVSWATGSVSVRNCVLYVGDSTQSIRYAMCGTGSDVFGTFANNLVVGMSSFHMAIDDLGKDTLGYNGNWWVGSTSSVPAWRDLFTLTAGATATNVQSVKETAATFDKAVWNTSGFGANKNGRPTLIKGCSVNGVKKVVTEYEFEEDKNDKLLGADKEWGHP